MKKLSIFLLILTLAVGTLFACGGGDNGTVDPPTGGDEDDGKSIVYSPTVSATVIRGEGVSAELANELAEAIRLASGRMAQVRDAEAACGEHEIVIGTTDRDISRKALEYLEENLDPAARLGGYAVYSENNSVAIVATDGDVIADAVAAFTEKYVTQESLDVKKQLFDIVSLTVPEVDEAEWAARFDVYKEYFDDAAIAQLKQIYALFDEDVVEWMAYLWEPYNCACGECDGELACYGGGFYYANSSRDYVGFLPDVESTGQLLSMVRGYGMLSGYGGDIRKALPQKMQAAIVKFVESLQSETDKYFYHPQWGTDINSSRRGRDLDSSLSLLRQFGKEPLYGSPLDTSSGATSANNLTRPLGNGTVAAVSAVVSTSSLPTYLQSEGAFLEWLEGLSINGANKSYSAGHTISSIRSQIKAAGLDEFCIEWLNSKQFDNGLWEEGEVSYAKTNGLLKISTMYESWSVPFPRVEKGIEAFLEMLYSDAAVTQITDIYNIWVGLGILVPNLESFGEKEAYDAVVARLHGDAEVIFRKTLEKLLVLRKTDGSFSYFPNSSASSSQGELASLGFNEGDVNATALAHGTLGNMLKAFGVNRVDYYNNNHFERFLSIVENLGSVEKMSPENTTVDFNDYGIGDVPTEVSVSSNSTGGGAGTLEILEHSDKKGDMYVSLSSGEKCGDALRRYIMNVGPSGCFILDTDIRFMGGGIQIFVGNSVMLTANSAGSNIVLSDLNARSGGRIQNKIATVPKGEWINLRVEHYPAAAMTKFFVDGELVCESDNFLGKNEAGTTKPTTEFSSVEFYVTISAVSSFDIDNLLVDRTVAEYKAPEGDVGGEEEEKPVGNTVALPDGADGGSFYKQYGGNDYSAGTMSESDYWVTGSTVINGNPEIDVNAYARVVKDDDGDNSAIEYAKLSEVVSERHLGWKSADTSGDIFIFETDFLYTGCILDNADPWPIRFSAQNSESKISSPERTVFFIFRIDAATGDLVHNESKTVLKKGEWNNIGLKYVRSTGEYELYLNGEVYYRGQAAAGVDMRGVSAELRAYSSELTVYFDNTVCTTVSAE